MNNGLGATPLDIQKGKCETGYRGKEKLTSAEREAACAQAGMAPPSNQANVFFIGAVSISVIALCFLLGYSIYKRKIANNSKPKKRQLTKKRS